MSDEIKTVLRRASKVFATHDKARRTMKEAEQQLQLLCREYDAASGCRGVRVESLRIAVDTQLGKRKV